MKTYQVWVSGIIEVQAESEDDALEIALEPFDKVYDSDVDVYEV